MPRSRGLTEDIMLAQTPVREAPAIKPFQALQDDPTRPSVTDEPKLAIDNIQGNIVGFNKDHVTMLFLKIDSNSVSDARAWLARLVPFIATAAEVLSFNRLFKEIRRRRCVDSRTVQATWINIAFSHDALQTLTNGVGELSGLDQFKDEAFKVGLADRSKLLGDPADQSMEGNQKNWVFGGKNNEADIVIIVASDSAAELANQVNDIEDTIYSGRTPEGERSLSGVKIIYKQHGNTLPSPLTGHEHFGFLDGVSQPGLRGRVSDSATDVLTPRQNPDPEQHLKQGKPGQDLLWPGEFIFGYPGQDPNAADITVKGPNSLDGKAPKWAQDGSFLVIRRLRQEVRKFHDFLKKQAADLKIEPDLLGAKLVGRWPSGAPIERTPKETDIPGLGDNDCANNNFEFDSDKPTLPEAAAPADCVTQDASCRTDNFPTAKKDDNGARCPFSAHIRKSYPRDDTSATPLVPPIGEVTTQTHRLLRRGIPFGDPFYPGTKADSGNRGLLFACYQTSIEGQFEFVVRNWVNNENFKDKGVGTDPILGQNSAGGKSRARQCVMPLNGRDVNIDLPEDWVIPTGGGYFFSPSISTLCELAGVRVDKR
jgi:Dyp-type peroxidase family